MQIMEAQTNHLITNMQSKINNTVMLTGGENLSQGKNPIGWI